MVNPDITICTIYFNIKKLCILSTQYIFGLRVIVKSISDYIFKQYRLVGLCVGDVCLL
jgi:hypothetical protein